MVEEADGSWEQDRRLVLSKLDDLHTDLAALRAQLFLVQTEEIVRIKVDLAMLKVKAGLWGAGFGALPAACLVLYTVATGG